MAAPLADRLRPQTLDDMVGQSHLIGPGKPLRRIVESGQVPNLIFYGPSGVGKTTLAGIIAGVTNRKLFRLNATTASTADIKGIASESESLGAQNGILLYLDEIQYFSKKQQQTLLEHIENGKITLIASTTENPYFYVYSAILSRSTVFEFKDVTPDEIEKAVCRAFEFLRAEGETPIELQKGVERQISISCGGDVRKAMNAVELSVLSAQLQRDGSRLVTVAEVEGLSQKATMKYDKSDDAHYDVLSAFQKSMRGSDPDAALHYLARLLEAGDLPSACRRLIVCACEDVGLAYPMIIPIVKAAVDSALQVGLPEARIPLADAVVLVATSPKSNSAYVGIDRAIADIRAGKSGPIPRQLQNKHFDGADNQRPGQFYQYAHSFEHHWVKQQYLPDSLKNAVYYEYSDNKNEQAAKIYWDAIKTER